MRLTIDECCDANGHWTIRPCDDTPNGDTDAQPVATVFDRELADKLVQAFNEKHAG